MLQWGLLGTARINRLLIPAIRTSPRSALTTVASRDRARASEYAAEWGIPRCCSYEALLADRAIDVVYIPLPNSLHASWAIRAVEAGKHVLCEKPLALSTAEVDAMAAAAARHRRVVTEGFMYRHTAQTARLLALVADGAIGELRLIESAFTFRQTRERDVRLDPALGGGSLWDVGCYAISMAQLLAVADPREVSGRQQLGPTGVDEHFAGEIVYDSGVRCRFECGFRADYRTTLEVHGTGGTIAVDRPFRPGPVERLHLRRGDRVEDIVVEGAPIFADEVADMEDAALGVRPPGITLDESRRNVATIVRLYDAARA